MEENYHIKFSKTLLMLFLFLAIIAVLQLTRMGIINNTEKLINTSLNNYQVSYDEAVSDNAHDMGKICLIYDKTATDRLYIFQNFKSLLSKYSISYDVLYADEQADLQAYEMLIVIARNFDKAPILQNVFDYVENGGTAYFPIAPVDSDSFISVSNSLGIIEKSYKTSTASITDKKGLFGEPDTKYNFDTPVKTIFKMRLRSDCNVYFSDDENNPLLWSHALGSGQLYICSCDYLSAYESRGVIVNILYEILKEKKNKAFIYPVYSVATQILEEFPATYEVEGKILIDNGITYDAFIEGSFWPLIVELSKKYGAKTTVSYVLAYDESTGDDLKMNQLSGSALKTYATEVLKKHGEIAFHGYSMRPLGLDGELENIGWFIPWKSMDSIKKSFDFSKSALLEHFPNYVISTYIPPQGRISKNVEANLKELCPDLETVVAPYERLYPDQLTADFQKGENGLYYYSITTGENGIVWNTVNSLSSLGVSSPDIDINEIILSNNITFDTLKENMLIAQKKVSVFPDINYMTVKQAAKHISYCQNAKYSYTETGSSINLLINGFFDGISYALRTNSKIESTDDCTVIKYDEDYYVLYPKKSNVTLIKK